jgi:hypothetical protein
MICSPSLNPERLAHFRFGLRTRHANILEMALAEGA